MSEVECPVKVTQVCCRCDNCGKGYMKSTGVAFMTFPAKYQHECNSCGHVQSFGIQYPYIKHTAWDIEL